jgi:O-antigen/teichoic acid export membrane protein
MTISLSTERIKHWGLKGGMAILDQGIFSGSNFLLNILLARWLFPEDYGAYAIGFSVLVLFLQLLISYIFEPMGVLGPSSYNEDLKLYLSAQIKLYFVVTVPTGLLLALVSYLYGRFGGNLFICNILTAMGVMLSLVMLPWMLRRVFYVLSKPDVALAGSIIYAMLLILFTFVVKRQDSLTGVSTVFIVASAGLMSGLFLLAQLGSRVASTGTIPFKSVLHGNWAFGRWLVIASILMVVSVQAQIYITGAVLGLRESGVIYALQTLTQPMTLTVTAVTALITPRLAADYSQLDFNSFRRRAYSMTLVLTGIAVLFELFLIFCKGSLENVVYGGRFSADVSLIPIWGLSPLITSLVSGVQCSLQAAKYSYSLLIASLFWLPVSLGSCLLLIGHWGLWGVAWSTVLGYLALGVVLTFLYWQWLLKPIKAMPGI